VIYPASRGGVWTIDETRSFVPFGGSFPNNPYFDYFAQDARTGRVVGVGSNGAFVIDRGETTFRRLEPSTSTIVKRPRAVAFIPRYNGFVISDSEGLKLIEAGGEVRGLPTIGEPTLAGAPAVFDAAPLDAILVTANREAVLRYDDGRLVEVARLGQHDFITGVQVSDDTKWLTIKTGFSDIYVRFVFGYPLKLWASTAYHPPPDEFAVRLGGVEVLSGSPFERLNGPHRNRLTARSIGLTFLYDDHALFQVSPDGNLQPVSLPFDPAVDRISMLAEMPASKAVIVFSRAGAYVVEPRGGVQLVRASEGVFGEYGLPFKGIVPLRNEMLVEGRRSLYMILDQSISGSSACESSRGSAPEVSR
jgi:hypothetical protein